MNAKIISIINQKGGVAKTTSTEHLGIGLAKAGYRVLLVDADPQGSLTKALGYSDEALIMADANKQRTPTCMDKARTYRLLIKRYDIRMGERDTYENGGAKSTRAVVAEMLSVSEGTIQKYLRFLRLNESLQNMLEEGYFNVNVAETLSFLSAPVQDIVICYLMENGKGSIREENAKNLRNNPLADRLDRTSVYEILSGKKARKSRGASPKKLLLNEKKLNKYFPPEYTSKQVQEVTEFLFEHYLQEGIAAWKATKKTSVEE